MAKSIFGQFDDENDEDVAKGHKDENINGLICAQICYYTLLYFATAILRYHFTTILL